MPAPTDIVAASPQIAPTRADPPHAPECLLGLEDGAYRSMTKLGNYRSYRKRKGKNRTAPPKSPGRAAGKGETHHV